jgi:hypothetical protein
LSTANPSATMRHGEFDAYPSTTVRARNSAHNALPEIKVTALRAVCQYAQVRIVEDLVVRHHGVIDRGLIRAGVGCLHRDHEPRCWPSSGGRPRTRGIHVEAHAVATSWRARRRSANRFTTLVSPEVNSAPSS